MLELKAMSERNGNGRGFDGADGPLLDVLDASDPEAFLLVEREHQLTGLARLRRIGEATFDIAWIKANQLVHGFGTDRFWYQMGHPHAVETSFGTGHMVRILSQRSRKELGEPDNEHVLVFNPLGVTSNGGYMAEVANIFYEAGFVVWNVSPAGYEGKLPWSQVPKLTVKQQTRYVDEALGHVAEKLGVKRPTFHKFGGSQGGGIAVGMLYRDIKQGRQTGKTVAVTPSSGHNSHRLTRTLRYGKQFTTEEPLAIIDHIRHHPRGPLRRGLQLAPSMSLRPGALKHFVGAAYGLIFQPGHEDFLAQAETELLAPYFDQNEFSAVCFTRDVVARPNKWPGAIVIVGSHMYVVDERHARDAVNFFRKSPTPNKAVPEPKRPAA